MDLAMPIRQRLCAAARSRDARGGERQLFENQCLKEKLYPPDIARMVLWLAVDDSRMCTAQNFIVDAGWT